MGAREVRDRRSAIAQNLNPARPIHLLHGALKEKDVVFVIFDQHCQNLLHS
jgi:hypothetical protein